MLLLFLVLKFLLKMWRTSLFFSVKVLFFSENKIFYVSISGKKTIFFFVLFSIFKVKRKFYWILYSKINISILKSLRWTFNSYIHLSPSISVFSRVFQATTVLNNIRFVRWYMKWRLVATNSLAKRRKSGMASVVLPQSSIPLLLPGPGGAWRGPGPVCRRNC